MRRVLVVGLLMSLVIVARPAAATPGDVDLHDLGGLTSVVLADGAFWGAAVEGFVRIDPDTLATESVEDEALVGATLLTAGPDGNVWFVVTDGFSSTLGRLDVDTGEVDGFELDTNPTDLVAGPDGRLWYIDGLGYGAIGLDGSVESFEDPAIATTVSIAADAERNRLWLGDGGDVVVSVDAEDGSVASATQLPPFSPQPMRLAVGPDDDLWIVGFGVGHLDPEAGTMTKVRDPSAADWSLVAVGDEVWIAAYEHWIGRVDAVDDIDQYLLVDPTAAQLVVDDDGEPWVLAFDGRFGPVEQPADDAEQGDPTVDLDEPVDGVRHLVTDTVRATYACGDGASTVVACQAYVESPELPVGSGETITPWFPTHRLRLFLYGRDAAGNTTVSRHRLWIDQVCRGRAATVLADFRTGYGAPTPGPDVVYGGPVNGGGGDDLMCAGGGTNIVGGPGDDRIFGAPLDDQLRGGPGDDRVAGGTGRDVIVGGPGFDLCIGGLGADTFVDCEQVRQD